MCELDSFGLDRNYIIEHLASIKKRASFLPSEQLLASEIGLFSMELVYTYATKIVFLVNETRIQTGQKNSLEIVFNKTRMQ
jgi:hypothetical protein